MHRRSLEAPTSVLAAEMDLELLLVLEVFDRREGVQASRAEASKAVATIARISLSSGTGVFLSDDLGFLSCLRSLWKGEVLEKLFQKLTNAPGSIQS